MKIQKVRQRAKSLILILFDFYIISFTTPNSILYHGKSLLFNHRRANMCGCFHLQNIKPNTFKEANDLIDRYIHFYNRERIQNKTGVAPLTLRHSA
jgi:hypothetical protein